MLKKNEIIRLTITDLSNDGNGVGRYEGQAVFVPFTASGDVLDVRIVKVMRSFAYGIIEKIITPSRDRAEHRAFKRGLACQRGVGIGAQ